MAADTPTPNPSEDGKSNRRRSFRSKRRARKGSAEREQGASPAAPRTGDKPAPAAPPKPGAAKEGRERRRRRRSKTRTPTESRPAAGFEDNISNLPPLRPAFIYTHVIRPTVRDSYEFRSDHFSKVTRRLEDFNIDLTPMLRAQEEATQPFKLVLSPDLLAEFEEDEELQNELTEATADTATEDDAPSAEEDPDAAIREARRRRRARRARAKSNRRDRPDASGDASPDTAAPQE